MYSTPQKSASGRPVQVHHLAPGWTRRPQDCKGGRGANARVIRRIVPESAPNPSRHRPRIDPPDRPPGSTADPSRSSAWRMHVQVEVRSGRDSLPPCQKCSDVFRLAERQGKEILRLATADEEQSSALQCKPLCAPSIRSDPTGTPECLRMRRRWWPAFHPVSFVGDRCAANALAQPEADQGLGTAQTGTTTRARPQAHMCHLGSCEGGK